MALVRTCLAACIAVVVAAPAALAESAIFGNWHTENRESTVRLYACGDELCGVIVDIEVPEDVDPKTILDSHNEMEELRSRPLIGLEFLRGFERESATRWTDGYAYNPRDGSAADGVEIERKGPDILEISGCILWGAICQSETWTRADE